MSAGAAVAAILSVKRREPLRNQLTSMAASEELLLDLVRVFVFQVHVESAELLDSSKVEQGSCLRLCIKGGKVQLFRSSPVRAMPSVDEQGSLRVPFGSYLHLVYEGQDMLQLSILKSHALLPATTLGACEFSLKSAFEAIENSSASSGEAGSASAEMELPLLKAKGDRSPIGRLHVRVACRRLKLQDVGGRASLRFIRPSQRQVSEIPMSSEYMEEQLDKIHKFMDFQTKLYQAEAELLALRPRRTPRSTSQGGVREDSVVFSECLSQDSTATPPLSDVVDDETRSEDSWNCDID